MEEVITALLSGVAGGRRFWTRAPQKQADGSAMPRPYVVLFRIDGVPSYHYQGRDLISSRIQANCYSDTFTSAKQTARALIAAVEGHSAGIIQGIFIEVAGRDVTASDPGELTPLFAIAVEFTVIHSA
ncbi:hypothetical protein CN166_29880 [Sinorhizobium medicae]|uniref:tail completion protein gp17 n=1 Tax=Sinorhizobium medicae TaxID=110321 RepID=UPI000FD1D621|nr:hypothetical protein [Sinorhizobium medicae]RVJ50216.1 hypothetical protein CN166_29880 [Sinorhizobium medicae]RVJ68014.1 hypothetical protein CN167_29655 [Sinorhizobium medicae]RVK20254.1 hypothetical protein CN165_10220 [Sinorhizobium medicae]